VSATDAMPRPLLTAALWLSIATTAAMLGGCDSEPAEATPKSAPTAVPTRPKLLPGAKTKALEKVSDQAYDKTFDDLRFDMAVSDSFRRELLTEAINALDGRQIRIRGFILPTAQKRGIKQFVLVRDNQECCFGPGAALFDCILVEMRGGATAEYTIRPVAVSGEFGIQEIVGPDGRHLAIYHIDGESVK
jgi:hypothetical protein